MRLRLGINTCFAVKRWPMPDEWAPIVRGRFGLRLVQHSFDLVDTGTSADRLVAQAANVRTVAAAAGLEVHSTFTGLAAYSSNLLLSPDRANRDAALAWYRTAIAFTAEAGGIATGGHVGAFSVTDWEDQARRAAGWARLLESLAVLSRDGRVAGLSYLMVENLAVAREPSTMAMIRQLLSSGDAERIPIRLCLDVGHMCVPGTAGEDRDPYAWLRSLGPSASVVQLQQSDPEGDHHWPFVDRFNKLGRIRADKVIDALGDSGAKESALILEIIPPFEQEDGSVLDDLAASVEYWREALARRGVLAD